MPKLLEKTAFEEKLKSIRLLSLDVDGIQTDGGLYYTETGDELRKFNVKDGMGIKQLRQKTDCEVCIISASSTHSIQKRGERLGIEHTYTSALNKMEILEKIIEELGITFDQVAHMGDDLNDIPVLKKVGLPITVCDGVDEVKDIALHITQKGGGQGCVREICDQMIRLKSA